MSVLWCSDLHIKPASVLRKRTLSDDAFYALDQIENIAMLRGVSTVILGGDVYDSSTPSGEAVNRMAAFIRRLKEVGIQVFYIEGNHDRINKNPYLSDTHYDEHRLLSSIGAMRLETAKVDGIVFHGIDYCPVQKLHERLDQVPDCDVLCLHAGFRHLLGFDGAYDLEMEDIPASVRKLVLVGHVHTQDEAVNSRGVKIASSGSTWIWRVTEADKKHGVYILKDNTAALEYIELDCRKYYDITEVSDIKETLAEKHALPPVLFYDPQQMVDLDPSRYSGVVLIPRGSDAAEEVQEICDHSVMGLQEALQLGVPMKEYPEEFTFIKGLLDADDPQAYVDAALAERKVTLKEVV